MKVFWFRSYLKWRILGVYIDSNARRVCYRNTVLVCLAKKFLRKLKKMNRWINGCLWSKQVVCMTTPVLTPFDIERVRDCESNDKTFLYYLLMHRNKHKKQRKQKQILKNIQITSQVELRRIRHVYKKDEISEKYTSLVWLSVSLRGRDTHDIFNIFN